MKCLFIRNNREGNTGGAIISDRNYKICENAFQGDIFDYRINEVSKIWELINFIYGRMSGVNSLVQNEIMKLLREKNFTHVFLDSSLYGNLVKLIKNKFPNIKVICFFHNVEYMYFKELIKTTGKKRHYITLSAVKRNEKNSVQFSDALIVLNYRDSLILEKYYSKQADIIIPTSMEDKFEENKVQNTTGNNKKNVLFVGSRFFPNEEGVRWFIKNVMPNLGNQFIFNVIGKNFEELKRELETENIKIIGSVENLENWYYGADVVVSPIFSGGGMKTKIAEALMYGKTILGTYEAFEGYDINNEAMHLCENADDFIKVLKNTSFNKFNYAAREEFLTNFDNYLIERKFEKFLIKI